MRAGASPENSRSRSGGGEEEGAPLKPRPLESRLAYCAASFTISWITRRSLLPTSPGLISMWWLLPMVVISTLRLDGV